MNWCLLDEAYLESSPGDDTTWQKFFRLLGVLDFPIMKRVKVSVHGTEMVCLDSEHRFVKKTL